MSKHRKSHKQIVDLLGKDFMMVESVRGDDPIFTQYPDLPFVYYPDFSVCLEGNAYILSLAERKLSLLNRGGTVRQYAFDISFLLRFLHSNGIQVMDLTNNLFKLFVRSLTAERTENDTPMRSPSKARHIACRALDFIQYVSTDLFGEPEFVSRKGSIRAYKNNAPSGQYRRENPWICAALPMPSAIGRGFPVDDDSVDRLKRAAKAALGLTAKRDSVLISALEQTGGRIEEVNSLPVSEIIRAYNSKERAPKITVITVKKKEKITRKIPVPRIVIHEWMDYISTLRRTVMYKHKCGEHDFLLINLNSGKRLNTNTIGNILHRLKAKAGIKSKISAHMFRHRFITEKLKALILEFEIENPDAFRRSLLTSKVLKMKLMEWTGHKTFESLERYIHIAFSELTNADKVFTALSERESIKALINLQAAIIAEHQQGLIGAEEAVARIEALQVHRIDSES